MRVEPRGMRLASHNQAISTKFRKWSFDQIGFVPVVLTHALDKQKLTFGR